MPSPHSGEIKAQALALVRLGETAEHAAETLGLPARTVQTWAWRQRQVAAEQGDRELLDEDYRLALRSSAIIHDAYDYIQEDESGERASKSLIALNAIRGTAIDKILKRQERPTDSSSGPFVIYRETVREVTRERIEPAQ